MVENFDNPEQKAEPLCNTIAERYLRIVHFASVQDLSSVEATVDVWFIVVLLAVAEPAVHTL